MKALKSFPIFSILATKHSNERQWRQKSFVKISIIRREARDVVGGSGGGGKCEFSFETLASR